MGGLFARTFRSRCGPDLCKQVNRALDAYSASRYPDAAAAEEATLREELALARRMIHDVVPALINDA